MSIDRSVRPFFSAPANVVHISNMNSIPTNKDALTAWLVDLSGNVAVSHAGIAFLDAQKSDFENKCRLDRGRIDEESTPATARRESLEAAPKRDSNFKLGQSIGLLFQEKES